METIVITQLDGHYDDDSHVIGVASTYEIAVEQMKEFYGNHSLSIKKVHTDDYMCEGKFLVSSLFDGHVAVDTVYFLVYTLDEL